MSHYDIVMDECQGRKVDQAGEIKIMQNEKNFFFFFSFLPRVPSVVMREIYLHIDHISLGQIS